MGQINPNFASPDLYLPFVPVNTRYIVQQKKQPLFIPHSGNTKTNMSDIVIQAEGLSKKYLIGHQQERGSTTFREMLTGGVKNTLQKTRQLFAGEQIMEADSVEEFWALRDLNFEIKRGDRVGIIGRNGAGKSTLLKILSRITEPTKGQLRIRGRVASLLEVGTGFHAELSGRENIFLNGAILGMSRQEIKAKFDEIVDFAGVEKFLDTPVKRYSSGMYVRLAFAVAAHLEPEILIVDEVLAVGDAEFQKKCLGKMEEVSAGGERTVLFVSHNMESIQALCNAVVWLDQGEIKDFGQKDTIISNYLSTHNPILDHHKIWSFEHAPGSDSVKLLSCKMIDRNMNPKRLFNPEEAIGVCLEYEVYQEGKVIWNGFNLYNDSGVNLFDSHSSSIQEYKVPHKKGRYEAIGWIYPNLLNEGDHIVGVALFNHQSGETHCHVKEALTFSVIDGLEPLIPKGYMGSPFPGVVRPYIQWQINHF